MIRPGLERISQLLKNVDFPWKAVHVAGTNGKGSICHTASLLLSRRHIKCGKFSSPHLVDRWDCIQINNEPVKETLFRRIEDHYIELSRRESIEASPFEILTATAFHIFNEAKVDIGVVEVGMGGRLDATNILNNQILSIISKVSRDHEAFLGNTLEGIARHKAGILRPNVPYLVNPVNEWIVHDAIDNYAKDIGAGPRLTSDSIQRREEFFSRSQWHRFAQSLQPFQRDNAVLGIMAAQEAAKTLGLEFGHQKVLDKLMWFSKRTNPGRQERIKIGPVMGSGGRTILVDGAHNYDAAQELADFVYAKERMKRRANDETPRQGWPVTWVMAMTEGKDVHPYLRRLLRSGDNLITTSFGPVDSMPWVKPMDPIQLVKVARIVQPGITAMALPKSGAIRAVCAANYLAPYQHPIVLTGSLYLVGDLHRELRARPGSGWWTDEKEEENRVYFRQIHEEERNRVNTFLSTRDMLLPESTAIDQAQASNSIDTIESQRVAQKKLLRLQSQIATVDNQMQSLEDEEQRILHLRSLASGTPPKDTVTSRPMSTSSETLDKKADKVANVQSKFVKGKFFSDFEDIQQKLRAMLPSFSLPRTSLPSSTETSDSNSSLTKSTTQGKRVKIPLPKFADRLSSSGNRLTVRALNRAKESIALREERLRQALQNQRIKKLTPGVLEKSTEGGALREKEL